MIVGRAAALLAALLLWAGGPLGATARAEERGLSAGSVEAVVTDPWAQAASKGLTPLLVDLRNLDLDASADGILEVSGGRWGNHLALVREFRLAPGEARRVELAVPAYFQEANPFRLTLDVGGTESSLWNVGGQEGNGKVLVAVVTDGVAAGRAEAWAAALVQGVAPDRVATEEASGATGGTHTATTHLGHAGYGITVGGSSSSSSSKEDIGNWRNLGLHTDLLWSRFADAFVHVVTPAALPRRWESYSSLDVCLLDSDLPPLPDAVMEGLLAWVRLGGVLVVCGPDGARDLNRDPRTSPWVEERFRLASEVPGIQAWQAGFGRIVLAPDEGLLEAASTRAAVRGLLGARVPTGWMPSPRGGRGAADAWDPDLPGIDTLPYRGFVVMMVLFALLVGPVNFRWVRRSGSPTRLLFTIPAVALFWSLATLGYGLFGQGVSVRVDRDTVVLLDQRAGRAEAVEFRALFAGLAPGRGLVPGQGSVVVPLGDDCESPDDQRHWRIEVDEDGGRTALRGHYLPARTLTVQAVLTDRESRLRLDAVPEGDGLRVRNGLGVDLEDLVLHAEDGRWYAADAPLVAGGEVLLARATGPRAPALPLHPAALPELPRGTYAASASAPPLTDAAGLDLDELGGRHRVLGILGDHAAAGEGGL